MGKERNIFSNLLKYLHYGLFSIGLLLMAVVYIGCKNGSTDLESTAITGTLTYDAIITSFGEVSIRSARSTPTGTVTYSIAPETGETMPIGISIDETTGVITISAEAVVQSATEYTVTATGIGNYIGTTTATVGITITAAQSVGAFSYDPIATSYGTAKSAGIKASTLTGTVTYSIAPVADGDMPRGIILDSGTGEITVGTGVEVSSSGRYTVTVDVTGNYTGTTTATVDITITQADIGGAFSYDPIATSYGTAKSAGIKTSTLTGTVTYSIAPTSAGSMSNGITVDSGTGVVTVSDTVGAQDATGGYTVTATGTGNYTGAISAIPIQIRIYAFGEYVPKTKAELIEAINIETGLQGNNANLNMINTEFITDMSGIFQDRSKFNGDISGWNTSNVTNMYLMFSGARSFNGDISGWNTSSVTDMSYMFYYAKAFNSNISGWDVSSVTNMKMMFSYAYIFNSDISEWNTSSVTGMQSMFHTAKAFNGGIGGWNVSRVTNMIGMFTDATKFNSDISKWNVSRVTEMYRMFTNATSFNSDISKWIVSSVTKMDYLFYQAISFNQNLEAWGSRLKENVAKAGMFTSSGLEGNEPSWY